jgi:hypothetical protein
MEERLHVDYPHHPGRMLECAACMDGPCTCNPETDAPCASVHCVQEPSPCEWFAHCENDATGVMDHPVIGFVPICDRCRGFLSDD